MEIITNGTFETGALRPWRQTPGSAVLDGGVTAAASHTGRFGLELRSMDFVEHGYKGRLARATGDLTFHARASSALTAGPLSVRIVYRDGTEHVPFLGALSGTWQRIVLPVNRRKSISRIQFGTGETGPLYIDDVSLEGRLIPLVTITRARGVSPTAPAKRPRAAAARKKR